MRKLIMMGGAVLVFQGLVCADALNKLWEKSYSGFSCWPMGIASDSQSNFIVTGVVVGAETRAIKYDSSGSIVWSKGLGAINWAGTEVAIDSHDNAALVGNFPGNGYIFKCLPDGTTPWLNTYGAGTYANASVGVDKNDNFMVVDSSADENWMIYKYDTNGNLLWSNEYTGITRYPTGIASDSQNNIVVAGYSYAGGTGTDICVLKCDADGNVIWGPNIYDSGDFDYALTVSIDKNDNIYVSGDRRIGGVDYCYIRKYDKDGNFIADTTETAFAADIYASAIQKDDRLLLSGTLKSPSRNYVAAYDLDLSTRIFDLSYDSSAGTDQSYGIAVDTSGNVGVACNSNWTYLTIKYENNFPFEPSQIIDLTVSSVTSNSVDLTWTAPGDDSTVGTASEYDIRYLTVPITDGNWASAVQVSGEPLPLQSGNAQGMTVNGLSSSTEYYFAVKTLDEAPNTSVLSNVITCQTMAPPATPSIPPEVNFVKPLDGAKVFGLVSVRATAMHASGISKIEYYLDDVLTRTLTASPYDWEWNSSNTSTGNHVIKVIAYSVSGSTSEKTITVRVVKPDRGVVYPNPFVKSKSTGEKINFGNLPAESTIRIYTLSCELVKTIKHEQASAGGTEEWNIAEVPSGVYLYTIISSEGTHRGKVSIIK